MNLLGCDRKPFLFIIDYEMKNPIVLPLEEVEKEDILYKVGNKSNFNPEKELLEKPLYLEKYPISFQEYQQSFDIVKHHLMRGNSFLVNLTKPTPIKVNLSLKEIFERSSAQYQLYFKNQFVLFSPEIFVKIKDGIISSHPMKGTISANIPNAESEILNNKKELAEHATIVDLIRNDISKVANKV